MKEGNQIYNKINLPRSPSPKAGRNKNSFNNKSTNSKYNNLSSNKKNYNPSKNFTIDSDKNKNLFGNEDEENKNYEILATNIRIQNKLLEEYQNWTNILLSVIDNQKINNSYNDIGTPIQQGLEQIEKLKIENFQIKNVIIEKKANNENLEKLLDKKQKAQNMIIKEFNERDKNKELNLKKENEQLNLNVQMLANEVDELNENNKQLLDKIINDNKLKKIYDLYMMKKELKEENKLFKKMMVFQNRKNYIDLQESLSLSLNKINIIDLKNKKYEKINKSYTNIPKREYGSIGHLSGYGEYKLEKEENINTSDSIFFCGL